MTSRSAISRLLRLARTVRYLRPIQVAGRAWHLMRPRYIRQLPPPARRALPGRWRTHRWRSAGLLGAGRARFIGEEHRFAGVHGWDDRTHPKLWRYHLHYHDDLVAVGAESRRADLLAHAREWCRENPPGRGTGWEPYPTSIRIVNWVKWFWNGDGEASDEVLLASLATQCRSLRRGIEWHLLANHLWANAKALVFGGVLFDGPEADEWLRTGLSILETEAREQILGDGGHFERSPMYHAIILEDVLDLLNLADVAADCFPESWRRQLEGTARRMRRWLEIMTHPDGRIAFFNDAAFGVAPSLDDLDRYAAILGVRVASDPLTAVEVLPDSGYVRLTLGQAVVICDAAPVGPDYQPGHAHADTLSFELSLDGRRLVVNGGTSTYVPGNRRATERGTAAHSTVVVDEEDSSEVWAGFRVARRARPRLERVGQDGATVWVEASHDGYRRLPGRVTHARRWELSGRELRVRDSVAGRPRSVRAVFHLAPAVRALDPAVDAQSSEFILDDRTRIRVSAAGATIRVLPDEWPCGFSDIRESLRIEVAPWGHEVETLFTW